MDIRMNEQGSSKVAIISAEGLVIKDLNDALDLMANVQYSGCDKMLLRKEQITEDFFELKTKLAGDILQKYTNYKMKIAIVGDFSSYNSKSLSDFIYECNQGDMVLFKATEEEALVELHRL